MSATSLGPVYGQGSVMEFGLDQMRTGQRLGSSRFELSQVSTCRDSIARQRDKIDDGN